ncbi:MAG: O-antigen ligase family protein [Nitrospiraceae bacterium]
MRIPWLLLSVAGLTLCLAAGSRSALGGVLTSLATVTYLSKDRLRRRERLSGAFFVAVLALSLAALPSFFHVSKLEEIASRIVRIQDAENVRKLGGRMDLWLEASAQIAERPIVGRGIGWRAQSTDITGSVHNAFLEAALSSGVAGATCLVFALLATAYRLNARVATARLGHRNVHDLGSGGVAIAALGLLIYATMHSFTESSLAGVNNVIFLAAIYSITIAQNGRGYASRDWSVDTQPKRRWPNVLK